MKVTKTLFGILTLAAALALNGYSESATAVLAGFDQQILDRNDDGSTDLVPIGFTIDFLGNTHDSLYVNNNGNVTFAYPLSNYSPTPLVNLGTDVIAPFWADVDTRNPDSGVVTYGTNTVNGNLAFGVDWVNVGYYSAHADALLSCQLVLISRPDLDPGDFDMEFNYDTVQWQWGDVSVGDPPRAGFANGIYDYELPGSGVDGAFLDTNQLTGLINNGLNSSVPGSYVFYFRDGTVIIPEPAAITLIVAGLTVLAGASIRRRNFTQPH